MRELALNLSGGTDKVIPLDGDFLHVFSASADFKIRFDEGSELSCRSGSKYKVSSFSAVRFSSTSNCDIVVKYGFDDYIDGVGEDKVLSVSGNVFSKPSSSALPNNNDVTIPTGGSLIVIGANTRVRVTLQRVDSNGGDVRVWGSGVGVSTGLKVAQNGLISIETGAALYCNNVTGADVTFAIGEEI